MKRFSSILGLLLSLWSSLASANVPCTLPFNLLNGTTADATQVMANYNALVTCLTNAAAAGANNDITSLSALSTPITPVAGGSTTYIGGTSTGSANAQVVGSVSPLNFTLVAGKRIVFIAGFTNTGALTFAVNGTAATNVFRYTPSGPIALTGGEVVAGNLVEAVYDGTQYQLYTNAVSQQPGFGPLTNLASATTTDLGTIPSHTVNITGTTTITGFGSSAVTTYPIYNIVFSGVLTLTYNASSLILPGVASIKTAANDSAIALYLGSGNWQVLRYTKAAGTNPTSSIVTSSSHSGGFGSNGSGTYTTPGAVFWIEIWVYGPGGGGGGGQNTVAGSAGTPACWNTSGTACTSPVYQAAQGGQGTSLVGGVGGAVSGSGTPVFSQAGQGGGVAGVPAIAANAGGGIGGSGGCGGAGGNSGTGTGSTGGAPGGGGAGGGATNVTLTGSAGYGGAGGACLMAIITGPAGTYTYDVGAVGTGGTGGSAGSSAGSAGGNGGPGKIVVIEHYGT
jgi:hypothetical protein